MTEPVVTWEDAGPGVLVATMDRRPANALGPPIMDGLNALLDDAERRGTRVLVLTSAIPGFFAAGGGALPQGREGARALLLPGRLGAGGGLRRRRPPGPRDRHPQARPEDVPSDRARSRGECRHEARPLRGQAIVRPPLTDSVWPVTKPARSEAR